MSFNDGQRQLFCITIILITKTKNIFKITFALLNPWWVLYQLNQNDWSVCKKTKDANGKKKIVTMNIVSGTFIFKRIFHAN